METLDDFKKQWHGTMAARGTYNEESINKIVKSRVNKHLRTSMQYFWASLALQILVYALLSHVVIKYFNDSRILIPGISGVLLFIPFTFMLLTKFKRLALENLHGSSISSIHEYLMNQRTLLNSFFIFKKQYELILIPLATAIGVLLTFTLYVPGGVMQHVQGVIITFILSLISCYVAIHNENQKSFIQPLQQLDIILEEYKLP